MFECENALAYCLKKLSIAQKKDLLNVPAFYGNIRIKQIQDSYSFVIMFCGDLPKRKRENKDTIFSQNETFIFTK
jgi:hypothetical protein